MIVTKKKKDAEDEKKVYEMYYDFKEAVSKAKSYRILAINRAEKEKVIRSSEIKVKKKASIKRGQVFNALVIKSKYNLPRFNGQKITFDNNGCILVDNINFKNKKTRNKLTLLGSNVFGVALKEFRLYSIKLNINAINIL